MADTKIKILPYMIKVRIRCIDDLPELKTKGYPVILEDFREYKFAIHRKVGRNDASHNTAKFYPPQYPSETPMSILSDFRVLGDTNIT